MVVERAPCLRRVVVDLVVGNVLETTPSSLDFEEALGKSRFSLWNNFRKKKNGTCEQRCVNMLKFEATVMRLPCVRRSELTQWRRREGQRQEARTLQKPDHANFEK